jgi:hypothetical protein
MIDAHKHGITYETPDDVVYLKDIVKAIPIMSKQHGISIGSDNICKISFNIIDAEK